MTEVDEAIAEIDRSLAEIVPKHEGLRDYARLDLKPVTLTEINFSIGQFDRRVALLRAGKAALEALSEDAHPSIPVREIPQEAFEDLQEQASTIQAAKTLYASGQATSLSVSAGPIEDK